MSKNSKSNDSRKLHIVFLVDRSGSMQPLVGATIDGVNDLLRAARNSSEEAGVNAELTMVGFDSQGFSSKWKPCIEFIEGYSGVPIGSIKPVGTNEIFGRGGTPMWDAIAEATGRCGKGFGIHDRVLFVMFTDGQSEISNVNPPEKVAEIVRAWQDTKKWTFVMVAANQDAKAAAAQMFIHESNAMEYQATREGTRSAFYRLARGTRAFIEKLGKEWDSPLTDGFFPSKDIEEKECLMKVSDLGVIMNMPEASKDGDPENKLPPYAPVPAFVVDEYPACPANWMHGSAKASSYFVGVRANHGMWLDFNRAAADSKHHLAIVVSVQGINPVTGQKTDALRLEKYETKCPIHDIEFHQDRFCPTCGYKWPAQNYISTSATPDGKVWLDGFLTPEGKVRQYLFTQDEARGVAGAVLGKDQQVYAIGVALYRAKKEKPIPVLPVNRESFMMHFARSLSAPAGNYRTKSAGGSSFGNVGRSITKISANNNSLDIDAVRLRAAEAHGLCMPQNSSEQLTAGGMQDAGTTSCDFDSEWKSLADNDCEVDNYCYQMSAACASAAEITTEKYEVAAGSSIKQVVYTDATPLDEYESEPVGMLYISYCSEKDVENILKAGRRAETKDGFIGKLISKLTVGNP